MDDLTLIQQAQRGNREAFLSLYEQYHQPIYRYIFYRVGDEAIAEDLTADLFVRLVDKIRLFKPRGRPFLAWLYTMAGNMTKDYQRRQGRIQWLPLQEGWQANQGSNPLQQTHKILSQEKLMQAIRYLTDEQQTVILLKFVERQSNATIAGVLGKSEGAVKSLQHRALAKLREFLEEVDYEPINA